MFVPYVLCSFAFILTQSLILNLFPYYLCRINQSSLIICCHFSVIIHFSIIRILRSTYLFFHNFIHDVVSYEITSWFCCFLNLFSWISLKCACSRYFYLIRNFWSTLHFQGMITAFDKLFSYSFNWIYNFVVIFHI